MARINSVVINSPNVWCGRLDADYAARRVRVRVRLKSRVRVGVKSRVRSRGRSRVRVRC